MTVVTIPAPAIEGGTVAPPIAPSETSAAPTATILAAVMDGAEQTAAPDETVSPPTPPIVVAETVEIGDEVLFVKASDAATEARAIRASAAGVQRMAEDGGRRRQDRGRSAVRYRRAQGVRGETRAALQSRARLF